VNLYFRLLYTYLFARFRPPVSMLDACLTPFRCWPNDLDVLRHMTNGRYFTLLDIARIDLMIRARFAKPISDNGMYPVVVAETMRFRKSIEPFQKFLVETQVLGWDEKAFVLSQRFLRGEKCVAEAIIRARFLRKTGGSVSPKEILALGGITTPSPTLSPEVSQWNQNQSV
jgi:acyl-CoA thioesterase FadM